MWSVLLAAGLLTVISEVAISAHMIWTVNREVGRSAASSMAIELLRAVPWLMMFEMDTTTERLLLCVVSVIGCGLGAFLAQKVLPRKKLTND